MVYNKVKFCKHALAKKKFKGQKPQKNRKQSKMTIFEIFVGYACTLMYYCRVNNNE